MGVKLKDRLKRRRQAIRLIIDSVASAETEQIRETLERYSRHPNPGYDRLVRDIHLKELERREETTAYEECRAMFRLQ